MCWFRFAAIDSVSVDGDIFVSRQLKAYSIRWLPDSTPARLSVMRLSGVPLRYPAPLSLDHRRAGAAAAVVAFMVVSVREQVVSAGLSSFSCVLRSGLSAGGQVVRVAGGLWPMLLRTSVSQCCPEGPWAGTCRTRRRWGRAGRAGMVMMHRRRVAPRATD